MDPIESGLSLIEVLLRGSKTVPLPDSSHRSTGASGECRPRISVAAVAILRLLHQSSGREGFENAKQRQFRDIEPPLQFTHRGLVGGGEVQIYQLCIGRVQFVRQRKPWFGTGFHALVYPVASVFVILLIPQDAVWTETTLLANKCSFPRGPVDPAEVVCIGSSGFVRGEVRW